MAALPVSLWLAHAPHAHARLSRPPPPPSPRSVFADARCSAAATHAGGGAAPARRRSLDAGPAGAPAAGAQPAGRRRRSLLARLAEEEAANSSGDDALHSTYAAMARRLRRGAAVRLGASGTAAQRSRWAGRLVVLAGIKMFHTMLTSRRFG